LGYSLLKKIEKIFYYLLLIKMSDICELIFELINDWYGIQLPLLSQFRNFSEEKFADLWTNMWFAKREKQLIIDNYLKKYQPLFEVESPENLLPENLMLQQKILYNTGWMILYDQVSRNIYRGSAKAYETDSKAYTYAQKLMEFWNILPTPIRVSIILVYIHSEDTNDLAKVKELLNKIEVEMRSYNTVWTSLNGIATNHRDRMNLFGRIPERNKFLNRNSTEQEITYMSSFGI
jgi:hypothetical protein